MKRTVASISCLLLAAGFAFAEVRVGELAPDFELEDSKGNTYKLSDYRGEKAVVLEFFRSGDW